MSTVDNEDFAETFDNEDIADTADNEDIAVYDGIKNWLLCHLK